MKYKKKRKIRDKTAHKAKLKRLSQTKIVKKQNRALKLVKGLGIGIAGLSLVYSLLVGGMTAYNVANSPYNHSAEQVSNEITYVETSNYTRAAKNIKDIIKIAPKGSIVYTDYFAAKNKNTGNFVFDQDRIKSIKNCKDIKVYFAMDTTDGQRQAIVNSINFLNNINQKTYTGMPKVVPCFNLAGVNFDYESPIVDGSYQIFVLERMIEKDAIASTLLGTGIISYNENIYLKDKEFGNVLLHELMHEIYGFDDMYLIDNFSFTVPTIMNAGKETTFCLNDLYLIDALCWDKDLTLQQKKDVRKFYAEFAKSERSVDFVSILAYKLEDIIKPIEYEELQW